MTEAIEGKPTEVATFGHVLSHAEIKALADPSDVNIGRLAGTPCRFWPLYPAEFEPMETN